MVCYIVNDYFMLFSYFRSFVCGCFLNHLLTELVGLELISQFSQYILGSAQCICKPKANFKSRHFKCVDEET